MHILIKKKYLIYGNYKVKCAVGKRGIGHKLKEGDQITPKGIFKIKKVFFRKDRIKNLTSEFKKIPIKKNMRWCDDPKSKNYNKLVKHPYKYNSERMFRSDNIYDIVLVLNFNMNPIKKNKGSAIFIHVARKNFNQTRGCVAIGKTELIKLLSIIKKNTKVKII